MNPFTTQKEETVSIVGECDLINRIQKWLGEANPPWPRGIGDDCAILENSKGATEVITVDPITYGVHFDDSVSAKNAGEKLVKRNASDIAAMGAAPRSAVLSLSLPKNTRLKWLEDFYTGLSKSALELGLRIVGGDLSSTPDQHLSASLCMIGQLSLGTPPLLRKKAVTGDRIFVTGQLGGSIHGKHYNFSPRIKEGLWLAKTGYASSCLDISDGLSKDALQLLQSATQGVSIDANQLPLSDASQLSAEQSSQSPIYHALNDGEDYELVFTVPNARVRTFISDWKETFTTTLSCIGQIIERSPSKHPPFQIINAPKDLPLNGYEHLR